jgi:protein-arginine kinase activator protein McsA
MLYKCPIYCSQSILSSAGILINDDGTISEQTEEEDLESNHDRIVSIEDLEIMMQQAIQNEDYEIAAEIRDRISSLRG